MTSAEKASEKGPAHGMLTGLIVASTGVRGLESAMEWCCGLEFEICNHCCSIAIAAPPRDGSVIETTAVKICSTAAQCGAVQMLAEGSRSVS